MLKLVVSAAVILLVTNSVLLLADAGYEWAGRYRPTVAEDQLPRQFQNASPEERQKLLDQMKKRLADAYIELRPDQTFSASLPGRTLKGTVSVGRTDAQGFLSLTLVPAQRARGAQDADVALAYKDGVLTLRNSFAVVRFIRER